MQEAVHAQEALGRVLFGEVRGLREASEVLPAEEEGTVQMTTEERLAYDDGYRAALKLMAEARQARKARSVEKCNHPAEFVCDYEDGTSHCLECVAEKFWQIEDILSGKHNVHTYWGALETIAHPERMAVKYDPVQLARKALGGP